MSDTILQLLLQILPKDESAVGRQLRRTKWEKPGAFILHR